MLCFAGINLRLQIKPFHPKDFISYRSNAVLSKVYPNKGGLLCNASNILAPLKNFKRESLNLACKVQKETYSTLIKVLIHKT